MASSQIVLRVNAPAGGKARSRARKAFGEGRRTHPATTMVIEHTAEDTTFLKAIEQWRNATGRQRPGWDELAGIVRSLGYRVNRREGRGPLKAEDFDRAVEDWRVKTGYRWPTWTDQLRILGTLGFRRAAPKAKATSKVVPSHHGAGTQGRFVR